MAQQAPRTRLEQCAQGAHLSVRDFVNRFHAAAIECGEDARISERQAKRWLAGISDLPRPICRRVLEHWWAEPVSRLLGPPDRGAVMVPVTEEELIVNAGRESVEHAIQAASVLDPSALEHLHDAAQRAAHAYYVTPPLVMLTDLIRLRDTVYEQLERTHKPRQQAELYLLAGQFCGLLSSVSLDFGRMDVAESQAQTAYTYGSVIDHQSLCAWARALQSNVYLWCDQPKRAISVAESELTNAPRGTARARLHAARARAIAMMGGRDETISALEISSYEFDLSGNDPLMDEIGGEFGFDRARLALCVGAAYVLLGNASRAEAGATQALELFETRLPHERWAAGTFAARLDLGTARTLAGNIAGTQDALAPVLALEPEWRTEALSNRMIKLARRLHTTRYRDATEARQIVESIADFTANSLTGRFDRLPLKQIDDL
ncbi:MAG TPA: hypothetical protein VGJ13_05815 [Pseudonocardiaceae bacterium]|jgi:hypothetical protein